jgi:hypothetical protein
MDLVGETASMPFATVPDEFMLAIPLKLAATASTDR